MEDKKSKKDFYNSSDTDLRTYINNEIAIKPYYYYRNSLLHVRYTVDRCFRLTPEESQKLKEKLSENPEYKQEVLEQTWEEFYASDEKDLILDGISEMEKTIREYAEKDHNEK